MLDSTRPSVGAEDLLVLGIPQRPPPSAVTTTGFAYLSAARATLGVTFAGAVAGIRVMRLRTVARGRRRQEHATDRAQVAMSTISSSALGLTPAAELDNPSSHSRPASMPDTNMAPASSQPPRPISHRNQPSSTANASTTSTPTTGPPVRPRSSQVPRPSQSSRDTCTALARDK
ncbi:MAG: hypothetical protein U0869_07320 [Chloroflexota bacterium]